MTKGPFVRLFGGPLIVTDGQRPSLTPAQRRLLAIVYLDAPDPVSREEVSWLLWETGEAAETRHRIRQLIYAINKDAPVPVIEREGDLLVPCLPTDANQIEPSLSPALRLVSTAGTTAFEHWLDTARERLDRRRVNRFAAALDTAAIDRDFPGTRAAASALIRLHSHAPPPEVVVDLAWALQQLGRHREAASVLQREIARQSEARDGPLTTVLRSLRTALPIHQSRPVEAHGTLYGRQDVLKRTMSQLFGQTFEGLLFYGPPGIGKSAVLQEIGQELTTRFPGQVVLSSFDDWTFGPRPFGLVQSLLHTPGLLSQLQATPEAITPVLAAALPDLAAKCGVNQSRRSIEPEPTAISRDFRRLLRETLPGGSAIVLADNLGTGDPSSCGLLADVLADPGLEVRIIGSATATDRSSLHASLMTREPRLTSLAALALHELPLDSSTRLLRSTNPALSQQDARRIYRALGGVPAYLLAASSTMGPDGGLPESIAEIAEQRLASLAGADRLLCSVLAVGGAPTKVKILAEVLELPLHKVSAAVERLFDGMVCRRQEDGVWFTQTFLATAAYRRLSIGERKDFHRRFLAVQKHEHHVASHSLRRHSVAAGETSASLHRALILEAENAESVGALKEASLLWHGARSAAGSLEDEGDAVIRQMDVLLRMREYDQATEALEEFLASTDSSVPLNLMSRLQLRALIIRSQSDPGGITTEEARKVVQLLSKEGTSLDLAIGLETSLRVADARGDPEFGRELLEVAGRVVPADPEAATWLNLACTRHLYLGNPGRGLSAARQAVVNADLAGKPGPLARALNRMVVALVFRGKLASSEGASVLTRARSIAGEFGDMLLLYDTYVNEGSWHMDTGDLDSAEEAFSHARELLGNEMSRAEALTTKVNQGELLLHQGRGAEALEEFRAALSYADGESTGALLCNAGMTLANLESGRIRKAREWAKPLERIDPSDRYRGNVSLVALAQARLAQAEGNRERALETLFRFADQMLVWMVPAALKLYLEAFRLAIRIKAPLERDRVLPVVSAVRDLGIPGHGPRILRLENQLMG